MTNKTYDRLKILALVAFPAVALLISKIGNIWGFEHGQQVADTIAAIGICLGTILIKSSSDYKKELIVEEKEDE